MIDFHKSHYDVADFRRLIHLLRQKDGCPWDSVQTHHSIRNNFLEETYEVCEAIDYRRHRPAPRGAGRCADAGDLHASIEEDAGHFNLTMWLTPPAENSSSAILPCSERKVDRAGSELKHWEKGFSTRTEALDAVARSPALYLARPQDPEACRRHRL